MHGGGGGGQETYKFSSMNSFSCDITVTSIPQTFILSSNDNVVTLIGRITEDETPLHTNDNAGTENGQVASSSSGRAVVIKQQLDVLQEGNKTETKNADNTSEYHPMAKGIMLQPDECPVSQLEVDSSSKYHQTDVENTSLECDKGGIPNMILGSDDPLLACNGVPKGTDKYFFLDTHEEVEETILKHTEETFSHFVVAKKTKAYGSKASVIDTSSKFRIHWQSRDLTSTEECAVQIPFQGVPFIYIGEKAYMCHLGRNKSKTKRISITMLDEETAQPKKHRSRLTKKQGCPAKIFVKQIAKFPAFKISCNSEYLRTQMSQKLRKAIIDSNGHINYVIQYVGTLPDISEHSNHDIGENTPVKEPIDVMIRDKIVELTWQFGDNALPKEIKNLLDCYVCEIFKGRDMPSKHRRRFYPSEKDIANYIYKSRLLSKLTCAEQEQIHLAIDALRTEYPDSKFILELEFDNNHTSVDFVDGFKVIKDSNSTSISKQKFLFVYQSTNQQRLLNLYGKQVILTEINKRFPNIPFPFYGVFVPTNMDYQLVFCFVCQSRTLDYIRQGLNYLLQWNPLSWTPKFFIVDFSLEQINVVEEVFPTCSVLISDLSREESWREWLDEPRNCISLQGNKEEVYKKLVSIANSFTEETLNLSAQNLENSQEWRLSESLRDWFTSDWLAEAKRWVAGYRQDDFMSSLHIVCNLPNEVSSLREAHTNQLRNKKMSEFISYLVKVFVPDSYQRYIEKNVSDYRTQYLLQKSNVEIPLYLENKTALVTSYILQKIEEAKTKEFSVNEVQSGIFWVIDKLAPNTTYTVSFGDAASLPSCICIDWLQYKLPCKHMASIFLQVPGWDWNMISTLYTANPILNLDFNCIDKEHEEVFLANWNKEERVKFCIEHGYTQVASDKEKVALINLKSDESAFNCPTSVVKSDGHFNDANPGEDSSDVDSTGHVNTLATDCDNVCQQLSSSIHQVADHTVLQKLKQNLQAVLNDVTLELSKALEAPTKGGLPPDVSNDACIKKTKYGHRELTASTASSQVSGDTVLNMPSCTTSHAVEDLQLISKCEDTLTLESRPLFLDKVDVLGRPESSEVWIFDPDLNIKLLKLDRQSILDDEPLSLEIISSVQNILKHQFSDVDGFSHPQKLAQNVSETFSGKRKVLQLHMLEGDHWSASARTLQDVRIFCCTLSSKATVIEQVLKMVPDRSCEDKILFIERGEKEHTVRNCSLYAIAYSVAFLFDIEGRKLVFAESEMRSHLTECLEDMCFSMFPVKTLKKSSS